MRARTLVLPPDARRELEQARNHDHRSYLREIAAALLKVADGATVRAVAETGLLRRRKPETVRRWLAKYAQGGLPALVHRPRGHRGFSPSAGGGAGAGGAPGAGPAWAGTQPLAAD